VVQDEVLYRAGPRAHVRRVLRPIDSDCQHVFASMDLAGAWAIGGFVNIGLVYCQYSLGLFCQDSRSMKLSTYGQVITAHSV
jgi:hypothetical protein